MSEEQRDISAADVFNVDDTEFAKLLLDKEGAPAPEPKKEAPPKAEEPVEEPVEEIEEPEAEEPEDEEAEPTEEVEDEEEPEEEEKPKKPPLTKFQVFDEKGEVEVPADLKFTYKANGKVYEDVPLEKVVQLAQMGHYNHEREQSMKQKVHEAETALQARQELENVVKAMKEAVVEMFEDPDAYDRGRDAYLNANTPEAKARRLEQENAKLREQQEEVKESSEVIRFVESRLAPYLANLIEGHPDVNEYEVYGKYSELIAPLLVKGRLPASRLPQVAELVERDLTYWVKGIHESRSEKEVKRTKELVREKEKTSLAKRKIARTTKPRGVATPARPAVKEIESADDFLNTYLPSK